MKYFFDNCISHKFVDALRAFGRDDLVHLREQFPVDTKDTVWMPSVASHGWRVVTYDLRIRARPEERELRRRLQLTTAFFSGSFQNLPFEEQSWRFVKVWPELAKTLAKAKPGECFLVGVNAKIEGF